MSGLGDMGNLLRQAQAMQREMDKAKAEISKARVEGTAGGGVVRVEVDGDGMVHRVQLSSDADLGDRAMVEDLLLAALRDGLGRARTLREERLSKVTGGLNLPGLF